MSNLIRTEKNAAVWVIDETPDYIQIKAEGKEGSTIMLDLTTDQAEKLAQAILMCLGESV